MSLRAPDLSSRRSRLADWLELQALTSRLQRVSVSNIRSQFQLASDDRESATDFDADADDVGEAEITERAADDLEEKVGDEIAFREARIGSSYPFEVETRSDGRSMMLRLKSTWETAATGELIYIFCLLDSGIRDGLIVLPRSARPLVESIGNVFQICSCIAVAGYINAEVVSFGFPRATGTGFLPALQAAWDRYGSYSILKQIPYGFDDKLKDGGVDIIAWRHFDDKLAGTLIMFVQVASGLDWKEKPVADEVKAIQQWFEGTRFEHFLPAICIPFPLWFDLDEPPLDHTGNKLTFTDGVITRFEYREAKFGIIFDRGRVARSCALLLSNPGPTADKIDGLGRVGEVQAWVAKVMAVLREPRSVA